MEGCLTSARQRFTRCNRIQCASSPSPSVHSILKGFCVMNACWLILSASFAFLFSIATVPLLNVTNNSSYFSSLINHFGEKVVIEEADLIVANGTIFTSDDSLLFADSMAIRKGRVIRVGNYSSLQELSGSSTKILNLDGKIVVPGFIDSHVHLISGGLQVQHHLQHVKFSPSWPGSLV